jgi:hypothetical protein
MFSSGFTPFIEHIQNRHEAVLRVTSTHYTILYHFLTQVVPIAKKASLPDTLLDCIGITWAWLCSLTAVPILSKQIEEDALAGMR